VSTTTEGWVSRPEYNDAYDTCERTYATLRIYTKNMEPDEVTRLLEVAPTGSVTRSGVILDGPSKGTVGKLNGWFLSTKERVDSKDLRRHVDCLLQSLEGLQDKLRSLQAMPDVFMDVSCYWLSKSGHSGPMLSPKQMRSLCDLNLEIWFDCY
jgi:Domain of unknown function (DUF4279)